MSPRPPNIYAGSNLDRMAHRRADTAWIDGLRASGRFVVLWDLKIAVRAAAVPMLIDWASLASQGADPADLLFLGLAGDEPWFAWVMAGDEADITARLRRWHPEGGLADLRRLSPQLPGEVSSRLALARALAAWHDTHRFCPRCGTQTTPQHGGHQRRCVNPACGAVQFPRLDPAVIMLVDDGAGACLMGRQKSWPPGLYSTLAGFVEPGESLEEAVIREVAEETGVLTTQAVYHSSQPWPFPQSLMLGFRARAISRRIRLDADEMDDARWFSAAMVRDPAPHGFQLPRIDSLARRLIDDWLAGLAPARGAAINPPGSDEHRR